MQLEWMGEYREVVEKLIHYCNVYAADYKREMHCSCGVEYSHAQIQVVEYLLENEDLNENMSSIATRLGITFSTFSKMVNKLEQKGLLEKFFLEGNKKNIVVRVSALGRQVYEDYARMMLESHYAPMFEKLQMIPAEYREMFAQALAEPFAGASSEEESAPVLIQVMQRLTIV